MLQILGTFWLHVSNVLKWNFFAKGLHRYYCAILMRTKISHFFRSKIWNLPICKTSRFTRYKLLNWCCDNCFIRVINAFRFSFILFLFHSIWWCLDFLEWALSENAIFDITIQLTTYKTISANIHIFLHHTFDPTSKQPKPSCISQTLEQVAAPLFPYLEYGNIESFLELLSMLNATSKSMIW